MELQAGKGVFADTNKKTGRLTWFKHFNRASQGHTLSVLWANNDTDAIALFWLILEIVSRFECGEERGKVTVSWSVLARETNWKPSKCRRVLGRISPVSKIEMSEIPGGYVSFLVPNWLDYQENRGGKRSAKNNQNAGRGKKKEERGKNILSDPIKLAHKKEEEEKDFLGQLKEIYELAYPLKKGKEKGLRLISKQITNEADLKKFSAAVNNYAEFCKTIDPKFIKHFSTFCNGDWRDYVEATTQIQTPLTNAEKTRVGISAFIKQAEANRA